MLDVLLKSKGESVNKVIALHVPDDVLDERICGRWIHKKTGKSYHVKFSPPKSMVLDENGKPKPESMKDDVRPPHFTLPTLLSLTAPTYYYVIIKESGDPLMQRPDDTSTALVSRLQEYHTKTTPILSHYKSQVRIVNANQTPAKVWNAVLESL